MQNTLRLTEIFHSIQGESLTVGCPTVFVRLTGCPLRCQYCDTAYAFNGGKRWSIPAILEQVQPYNCPYVCVTGGEPLAQPDCLRLLTALASQYQTVSLETSGAISIAEVDPRIMIVMDIKTPNSTGSEKNLFDTINHLKPTDQIKFVLCSREDYEWAKQLIQSMSLDNRCTLLFSPSWNQLNPTLLAEWIVADGLPVRLQVQLHKVLWHDEPGR